MQEHPSPTPSLPLYLCGGMDPGTPCDSSTQWPFTATPPPLPSHDQLNDSHGCTSSLSDNEIPPDQTLQPHDPICNSNINNNNTNNEHTMTTIYTHNARGLWQRLRDTDGNILVDAPPDLLKVEYILDYMRQHYVGAWLLQETWEEGDDFNTEIGGYHIFRHNADRGTTGRQHHFRGVAIILSHQFHEAWKLAGSPPPNTINPEEDFAGHLLCLNLKFDSFDPQGKKIKGKSIAVALILAYFPCNDQCLINSEQS
jgi:hypothetical protein